MLCSCSLVPADTRVGRVRLLCLSARCPKSPSKPLSNCSHAWETSKSSNLASAMRTEQHGGWLESSSCFPGLTEGLQCELTAYLPPGNHRIRLEKTKSRHNFNKSTFGSCRMTPTSWLRPWCSWSRVWYWTVVLPLLPSCTYLGFISALTYFQAAADLLTVAHKSKAVSKCCQCPTAGDPGVSNASHCELWNWEFSPTLMLSHRKRQN